MSRVDLKKDFVDFADSVYLNCATQGPLPRVAVAAGRQALDLEARPEQITDEMYFSVPDGYRAAVAALVQADSRDVAVTDSTTHGMMLLVNGLDWRSGDEVLLPVGEFPANRFPWLSLEKRGVVVREIDLAGGELGAVETLAAAITERTRVVSLAWVSYRTGERLDVDAIGELCRDRRVLYAIDASQGVGGLEFDLRRTPCDLLACSGYKWMLGPYGLGFAWISPEIGERLALGNINWFAVRGARDFSRLSECRFEFEPGARRFDINETASFAKLGAGTASARYLAGIGVDRAEAHTKALLDRVLAGLPPRFRALLQPDSSPRSNLLFLTADSEEMVGAAYRRLGERGVSVGWREGAIRVSPFVYNDQEDIDRLLEGLAG
ncbi:MAG: aminotransferase class V-fold PLP-dependent enzyme [Acidobacteriota bacterium]|nr:aminotransferase class V-fold PLP-dependent enzyme [Acidobacteriota bacterium]